MQTTKKNFHTHAYTLGEKRVPSSFPKNRYTCNGTSSLPFKPFPAPSDFPAPSSSAGGIATATRPSFRHTPSATAK